MTEKRPWYRDVPDFMCLKKNRAVIDSSDIDVSMHILKYRYIGLKFCNEKNIYN